MAKRSHRPDAMAVLAEACQRAAQSLNESNTVASGKRKSLVILETLQAEPSKSGVPPTRPVKSGTAEQPLESMQNHSSSFLAVPANQSSPPSPDYGGNCDELSSGRSLMQDWHLCPSPPPLLGPYPMSMTATTVSPQPTDNSVNRGNTEDDAGYYEVPEMRMHELLNCDEPPLEMMEAHSVEVEDEEDGNEDLQKEKRCEWINCEHPPFPTMKAYVAHVTEHITNEPDYLCKWRGCKRMKDQKTFKKCYMLRTHVRRHICQKPCKCTFPGCNKVYSRVDTLKMHERRKHIGERAYVCEFDGCDKAFTKASDRAKHQNRTHWNFRPYHCPVEVNPNEQCTKIYTCPSALRTHVRTFHNAKAWDIARQRKTVPKGKALYRLVRHHEWFDEVLDAQESVNARCHVTAKAKRIRSYYNKSRTGSWDTRHRQTHAQRDAGNVEQDVSATHFTNRAHTPTEAGHLAGSLDPWVDSFQTTISCDAVHNVPIPTHQDISEMNYGLTTSLPLCELIQMPFLESGIQPCYY